MKNTTQKTIKRMGASQIISRLYFFWGMLYAPPISFESVQVNTNAACSVRECMRAYGELRALTVGVYSEDEAVAYASRLALMCCSLARYVTMLKTEPQATCSADDLEYVARLVLQIEKECKAWHPKESRQQTLKAFVVRMLTGTSRELEEVLAQEHDSLS